VSECHTGVTVTLHAGVAAAETAKRMIDRLACGSRCTGAHFLFRMGPLEGGPMNPLHRAMLAEFRAEVNVALKYLLAAARIVRDRLFGGDSEEGLLKATAVVMNELLTAWVTLGIRLAELDIPEGHFQLVLGAVCYADHAEDDAAWRWFLDVAVRLGELTHA
jgi:hypothetical protein